MFLSIKKYIRVRQTMLSVAALMALALMPAVQASEQVGLTPEEAHGLVTERGADVLFIDVRDPVEIMFVGSTDLVDSNIPFLLVDRSVWDAEKNRFRLYRNPQFVSQVKAALAEKGLDETATIITMCRSGSERGLPSAQFLQDNGFTNATFVKNGFQGGSAKEGVHKGMRVTNGWQNDGFPWSTKMNSEKIYRLD